MAFQQNHSEGLCLRYPENFGSHQTVTHDSAVNMLLRAIPLSQQVPYTWSFVDKPSEGHVILLYLPPQTPFPLDGIHYQEQETRYVMPVGSNRELEVTEVKFGFIPDSQDTTAWRVRRRYRLHKGGHPQLVLVHYTRGPQTQISPALANQPTRSYPLRHVNEPAVYIMGEKMGQKVYPPGAPMPQGPAPGMPANVPGGSIPPMPMGFNPQAMLAQQNSNMEALERRREQQRARDRNASVNARPPPQRVDDEDSPDEADSISTRTLAMNRYKRNHELMNDVFRYATFGQRNKPPPPTPYSIFSKADLEAKAVKLSAEIDVLKVKVAEQQAARSLAEKESAEYQATLEAADVSMEAFEEGITV